MPITSDCLFSCCWRIDLTSSWWQSGTSCPPYLYFLRESDGQTRHLSNLICPANYFYYYLHSHSFTRPATISISLSLYRFHLSTTLCVWWLRWNAYFIIHMSEVCTDRERAHFKPFYCIDFAELSHSAFALSILFNNLSLRNVPVQSLLFLG